MEKVIKAIALDLDGTALRDDKTFSPAVKDTIREAAERDVYVIVATGRSLNALPDTIDELTGIRYAVTSNGSMLYQFPERKLLFGDCIKREYVDEIRKLIHAYHYDAEIFIDGQGYLNQEYYERVIAGKTFRLIEYVKRSRVRVPDILVLMEQFADRIENIALYFQDNETQEQCRSQIQQMKGLHFASAFAYNLEIANHDTSKMSGLTRLLSHLKISAEELMAIGDGSNDMEMISFAGIGVAMGNACEELKSIADYVAPTNEEDGVAEAIHRFVLDKGEKL